MRNMFIRLCLEEHGAVMAEYALMAALIAAALAATVAKLGGGVEALFQKAAASFPDGDGPSDNALAHH